MNRSLRLLLLTAMSVAALVPAAACAAPITWVTGTDATISQAQRCGARVLVTWDQLDLFELENLSMVRAPGTLGTTFGSSGFESVTSTTVTACAPDGSFYELEAGEPDDHAESSSVDHVLADGSVDETYSKTRTAGPSLGVQASAVSVDPQGRLLVVGGVVGGTGTGVTRLLPDGSIDTTFATNGLYTASDSLLAGYGPDVVRGRADGSVTVSDGYTGGAGAQHAVAFHLTSDGVLDTSWGSAGLAEAPGGYQVDVGAICTDAAGRVYVQRSLTGKGVKHPRVTQILRFAPDGTADHLWGANGVVNLPVKDGRLQSVACGTFGLVGVEHGGTFGDPVLGSVRFTLRGRSYVPWHGLRRVPAGLTSPTWVVGASPAEAPALVGMRVVGKRQRFVVGAG